MLGDRYFRKESLKKCSVSLKKEQGILNEKLKTFELESNFESKQISIEMKKLTRNLRRLETLEEVFKTRKEAREKKKAFLKHESAQDNIPPNLLEQTTAEIEKKLRVSIRRTLNEAQEMGNNIANPCFGATNAEFEELYGWNKVDFDRKEGEKIVKKIHNYSPFVKIFCDVAFEKFEKSQSRKRHLRKKEISHTKEKKNVNSKQEGEKNEKKENYVSKENDLKDELGMCEEKEEEDKEVISRLSEGFSALMGDSDAIEGRTRFKRSISGLSFLPRSTQVLFRLHEVVCRSFPHLPNNLDLKQVATDWAQCRDTILWQKMKPSKGCKLPAGNILLQKYQVCKHEDEKPDKVKRSFKKVKSSNVEMESQNDNDVTKPPVDWSELQFCRYLRANTAL